MLDLIDPQVEGTVLYDNCTEVAKFDDDGNLTVTCPEDGCKINIPILAIIKMFGNVRVRSSL